jgi:hypothetical protein
MLRPQNCLVISCLKQVRCHSASGDNVTFAFGLRPFFVLATFTDIFRVPLAGELFVGTAATATMAIVAGLFPFFCHFASQSILLSGFAFFMAVIPSGCGVAKPLDNKTNNKIISVKIGKLFLSLIDSQCAV